MISLLVRVRLAKQGLLATYAS